MCMSIYLKSGGLQANSNTNLNHVWCYKNEFTCTQSLLQDIDYQVHHTYLVISETYLVLYGLELVSTTHRVIQPVEQHCLKFVII